MAVTFRQMMNRVLTNLGEDELGASQTAITGKYNKILRNFINQIKEEIEDATQWRVLQSTETVTVGASSESAAIDNTNDRSRLLRVQDANNSMLVPMVHNVTDAASPFRMIELDLNELLRRRAEDTTEPQASESNYFAINQTTDGLTLVVWPACTTQQSIEVRLVIPQDRFAADATDLDTAIKVPALPVELGATWWALQERGEELGTSSPFSQERYRNALDAAVARDEAEQGNVTELVSV